MRKTPLLSHFCTLSIILPSQAEDKHKGKVEKKEDVFNFSAGGAAHSILLEYTFGCTACDDESLDEQFWWCVFWNNPTFQTTLQGLGF